MAIAYYFLTRSGIITQFFENPIQLQETILGIGLLAPLVIIFLQTFQTIISIFPSQVTTVAAGFIFGPILGTVYSLIGTFTGSLIVFILSRKYGEKIALKVFEKNEIHHFHAFFSQKKNWALLLARIIPIFPNDLISMAAGMTTISLRNFNMFSTLGFFVQIIILTYFGSELAQGKLSASLIVILIIIILLILVTIFRKKLKTILIKDLHKIEKEIIT